MKMYNQLLETFNSLFNFKNPISLAFLTSLFGVINHFIESYIWADPAQYGFLLFLILIDFVTGLLKAKKHKMFVPRKMPKFLITVFTYTFFLYLALTGSNMIPILIFLPPFVFGLFTLTTVLSIVQNMGTLGWLPEPIYMFIEKHIGMKIKELLKMDMDNLSTEYDLKIQGIISDIYNYTDAKGVFLLQFEGHTFRFQNPQTVGKIKYVIGKSIYNTEEIITLEELDPIFDCLGIRPECVKYWEFGNQYQFMYTYIFKLEGVKDSVLSPLLVLNCEQKIEYSLENETLIKLRKSVDNLVVNLNKMVDVKNEMKKEEEKPQRNIKEIAIDLEIPEEETTGDLDEIGNLFG